MDMVGSSEALTRRGEGNNHFPEAVSVSMRQQMSADAASELLQLFPLLWLNKANGTLHTPMLT